jgi:hypothetical protein
MPEPMTAISSRAVPIASTRLRRASPEPVGSSDLLLIEVVVVVALRASRAVAVVFRNRLQASTAAGSIRWRHAATAYH